MARMPANLGAILTAMVTPFDDRGRVDEEAAVRLMNHLVEHGSDGLVVCGTTGEAATLSDDEQLGVIALAVQEMRGRCPVVAGVGSNDTRHAVQADRAGHRARGRRAAVGQPVLQPAQPARDRRPLPRGGRGPPTCRSCSTTSRSGPASDMPNDLLAELAQLDHIVGVKQANRGQPGARSTA